MLIYEGLLYAAGAILLSIVLSIIIEPIAGRMLENMFWFYSYRFTLKGIFITAPVFLAAGAVLPALLYRGISAQEHNREVKSRKRNAPAHFFFWAR